MISIAKNKRYASSLDLLGKWKLIEGRERRANKSRSLQGPLK